MHVRAGRPEDRSAVRAVNLAAFDTAAEADLVDALRDKTQSVISLVAEEENEIVGHIMFSAVTMVGAPRVRVMGLAPMAVVPGRQRKGVGAALVRARSAGCTEIGFGAVVVLGHPSYYPRVGFQPSLRFGISGVVRYHEAFKDA